MLCKNSPDQIQLCSQFDVRLRTHEVRWQRWCSSAIVSQDIPQNYLTSLSAARHQLEIIGFLKIETQQTYSVFLFQRNINKNLRFKERWLQLTWFKSVFLWPSVVTVIVPGLMGFHWFSFYLWLSCDSHNITWLAEYVSLHSVTWTQFNTRSVNQSQTALQHSEIQSDWNVLHWLHKDFQIGWMTTGLSFTRTQWEREEKKKRKASFLWNVRHTHLDWEFYWRQGGISSESVLKPRGSLQEKITSVFCSGWPFDWSPFNPLKIC